MAIELSKTLPNGYEARYARPLASPSFRFDTGNVELTVGLYKDAAARFAGAEPADYDRLMVHLTDEERAAVAAIIYQALAREGHYPDGAVRDPDPEKESV